MCTHTQAWIYHLLYSFCIAHMYLNIELFLKDKHSLGFVFWVNSRAHFFQSQDFEEHFKNTMTVDSLLAASQHISVSRLTLWT